MATCLVGAPPAGVNISVGSEVTTWGGPPSTTKVSLGASPGVTAIRNLPGVFLRASRRALPSVIASPILAGSGLESRKAWYAATAATTWPSLSRQIAILYLLCAMGTRSSAVL